MALLAKSLKYERGFPWFVFDALPGLEYQEMGADYIHAILTGYTKPDDLQWNLYFPGHKIAMPQPITNGAVEYKDGTPPTLDNYSRDVAAFLSWAAEPNLLERRSVGLRVMIFLLLFAALLYAVKKRIWAACTKAGVGTIAEAAPRERRNAGMQRRSSVEGASRRRG